MPRRFRIRAFGVLLLLVGLSLAGGLVSSVVMDDLNAGWGDPQDFQPISTGPSLWDLIQQRQVSDVAVGQQLAQGYDPNDVAINNQLSLGGMDIPIGTYGIQGGIATPIAQPSYFEPLPPLPFTPTPLPDTLPIPDWYWSMIGGQEQGGYEAVLSGPQTFYGTGDVSSGPTDYGSEEQADYGAEEQAASLGLPAGGAAVAGGAAGLPQQASPVAQQIIRQLVGGNRFSPVDFRMAARALFPQAGGLVNSPLFLRMLQVLGLPAPTEVSGGPRIAPTPYNTQKRRGARTMGFGR